MAIPLALIGAGMVAQPLISGVTSYLASKAQGRRADQAAKQIGQSYTEAKGYQQPFMAAGQQGLNGLKNGDYSTDPAQYQYHNTQTEPTQAQYGVNQPFNYQADPGMDFRMRTGQQAVQSSAAGGGAGLSGATLKALQRYGQDLGSQEYGNAFQRYVQQQTLGQGAYGQAADQFNNNRNFGAGRSDLDYARAVQQQGLRYGQNQDLANYGQTASTNLSNMATGYGQDMASLYGQMGQNEASQIQGLGGMANNLVGMGLQGASLYNMFNPGTAASMNQGNYYAPNTASAVGSGYGSGYNLGLQNPSTSNYSSYMGWTPQ